jgi:3-oxoacyl-[acyl-carrier protein] reductase
VTGVSRRAGIGTAIALALARDGWDVARTGWRPYDATMPWGSDPGDRPELDAALEATGARTIAVDADLADVEAPARIFDAVETALGPVTALVLSHCHDVESGVLDTTLESFDRHFGVNARATWLLVRELGRRFHGPDGRGRIVGLTSDHVVGNLPYGASKGALDRIVLAAAEELHDPRHHRERREPRTGRQRLDDARAESDVRKGRDRRRVRGAGRVPVLAGRRPRERPPAARHSAAGRLVHRTRLCPARAGRASSPRWPP